jgi:hypothetical protein
MHEIRYWVHHRELGSAIFHKIDHSREFIQVRICSQTLFPGRSSRLIPSGLSICGSWDLLPTPWLFDIPMKRVSVASASINGN